MTSLVSWVTPASHVSCLSLGVYSNGWYFFQFPSLQSSFLYCGNFLPHNLDLLLPSTREFESDRDWLYRLTWKRDQACQSDTSPQGQQTFVLKMGGGSNDSYVWSPEAKGIISVRASTPCVSKMLPCLCVRNLCLESIILLQRISIVCHSTK